MLVGAPQQMYGSSRLALIAVLAGIWLARMRRAAQKEKGFLLSTPHGGGAVDFAILNADRVGPLTFRSTGTSGDVG